ncbi:MAG: type II secretion system F family protein [Streptomyces sp.]|uniref:type II secretion system F family protein n=1 Tax=Streptomyces sp. TaxID=1931 RepID=UPI003D6B2A72
MSAMWWTSLLAGAGCVAASTLDWRRERSIRRRLRALLGRPVRRSARRDVPELFGLRTAGWARWGARRRLREGAAAVGAAAFSVTVFGGVVGWLGAAAAAYGAWRWTAGRATTAETAQARAVAGQLPLAAELMAACLAAGSGPEQASDAVGRSLDGPLGTRLLRVATELRLGGEPDLVWGRFGAFPGGAGFARCMERAGTAGVPAVEPVIRLAAELRARQTRAATARARRAAVLVTGPLGLCFLPAFLAVGVAPVVLGLARSLL